MWVVFFIWLNGKLDDGSVHNAVAAAARVVRAFPSSATGGKTRLMHILAGCA